MTSGVITNYTAMCDGVKGSALTNVCPRNYPVTYPATVLDDMQMWDFPQQAIAEAIDKKGYKRPYDNESVPLDETTHLCCPACFREYQRWNKVFPIPIKDTK